MKKLAILQGLAEPAFAGQDTVKIVKQQQHPKNNYLGSIRPHKGHKLWELDLMTGDVDEAKYEATAVMDPKMNVATRKKVIKKSNCLYCTALNRKNAMKKFLKQIYVARIQGTAPED